MTVVKLLKSLKEVITDEVSRFSLPTAIQKGDSENVNRAPEVHIMRLPDSNAAKKKAPYVIVQYVTSHQKQKEGQRPSTDALVRMIFCVYCADEEEGAIMLLNVMEAVSIRLLKDVVIGNQFRLNTVEGMELFVYNDDTAPYYAGEMVTTWEMPPIEREVRQLWP